MVTSDGLPVGPRLREARERQGLVLQVVARSFHIPVKTLRALEEGDFSSLPADVYVRGFLRQYAEILGLDVVSILRAFAVERARFPVRVSVFPWTLSARDRTRLWDFVTPRTLATIGGGTVLLLILLYVLLHVRTYVRPPRLEVFEPPQDIEVHEPTVTVRGRTDATAEVSLNGERTVVRADGSFEEALGVGEGINAIRVLARSIGGREAVVVREILLRSPAAPAVGGAETPTSPTESTGPFSLTVRADGEVAWVQLTVDGAIAFSGLLLPSSSQTVRGEHIAVTSGKAARTRVIINGEDRGALGDTPGTIRHVRFTRNPSTGIVERLVGSSASSDKTTETR